MWTVESTPQNLSCQLKSSKICIHDTIEMGLVFKNQLELSKNCVQDTSIESIWVFKIHFESIRVTQNSNIGFESSLVFRNKSESVWD